MESFRKKKLKTTCRYVTSCFYIVSQDSLTSIYVNRLTQIGQSKQGVVIET